MHLDPPRSRPRGLSLERKLPLLITALLAAILAAGVLFAYAEAKQTAVDGAEERLDRVARQLSALTAPTVPARLQELRAGAAHPAVAAFLFDGVDDPRQLLSISSRHAQKSSAPARPRRARWNVWLCALTNPGSVI